jgi:hypothetical protein
MTDMANSIFATYGYPYRYISHTLFSRFVYIYLPSDFYPFTITTVPVPYYSTIERGPVYLGELRKHVLPITLYTLPPPDFSILASNHIKSGINITPTTPSMPPTLKF